MKTLRILTAVLASVLLLTSSLVAATNRTDAVTVGAGKGTPKIDGVISAGEWDNAPEIKITLDDSTVKQYGQYQGTWEKTKVASDYSASMKFMWDANALYILDKRVDDYCEAGGSAQTPWGGSDGNLIFIQTIDTGADGNADGYSHHVFYILGDGNGKVGGSAAVRINNNKAKSQKTVTYSEISVVANKTSDGWLAEVAVPWSVFAKEIPNFKPADNAKIAMSMVPIDFDKDGEFAQLCWVNQADKLGVKNGYDYGGWATLTLNPAPVVATTKAAATATKTTATAAKTADMSVIIAAVATLSLAGVVVCKKK